MDQMIIVIFAILVVALMAVIRYMQKKYGDNPQAWDVNKFLTLLTIAIAIIIIGYVANGVIQEPDLSQGVMSIFALVGGSFATLWGGQVVVAKVKNQVPTQFPLGGDITNPALLGLDSVVTIGARTYHPIYKMDADIMRTVTGQLGPEDLAPVMSQIAAAEAQRNGMGIPYYILTYSHGFYDVTYGAVPTNGDVNFKALIQGSAHDR